MAEEAAKPRSLIRLALKVLGVLAGIAVIVMSWQDYSELRRMKKIGVAAVVEPITSYTERKSKRSRTLSATINFKTTDGRKVSRNHTFDSDVLEDFKNNVPVRVLYDPANPNEFIFEKQSFSMWIFAFGAGLIIAALIFV